MKLTQPLSSGVIEKRGNEINVPCCYWGSARYPLPSECNTWIRLFENLRDNFTDEEISEINELSWIQSQSNVSGLSEVRIKQEVK